MKIEDGRGRGYSMSVSESNRANVSAKTAPRTYYVSRDDELVFNLVSIDASADAGDIIAYIKNISDTKNLFVKQVHLSSVNAALWKFWAATGTPAGTVLTPANLNLSSGRTSPTSAYGDGAVTGLTLASVPFDALRTPANSHEEHIYEGALILGPGNAIAVEYDTGTTGAADVTIEFYFEDVGREN